MAMDGLLGDIHAVESSCIDQQDPTGELSFKQLPTA